MNENLFVELEEVKEPGFFEKNAITIAIVIANLLVILGEFRVYDFVLRMTRDTPLAVISVLTVGLPFLLYEILWKQRNANKEQRSLAMWLGFVTLLVTMIIGVTDYIIAGSGLQLARNIAVGGVALMLSVHTFALLRYVYIDDTIRAMWNDAIEESKLKRELRENVRAKQRLVERRKIVAEEKAMADEFGEENVKRQKAAIRGVKYTQPVRSVGHDEENPTNR